MSSSYCDADLDGVKIDGCGGERNIGLFQSLLNQSSKDFLIQDCHDSRAAKNPAIPRAPPNDTWCPFVSAAAPFASPLKPQRSGCTEHLAQLLR